MVAKRFGVGSLLRMVQIGLMTLALVSVIQVSNASAVITRVGVTTPVFNDTGAATSSLSVPVPSGAAGDLLIFHVIHRYNATSYTIDAGWNQLVQTANGTTAGQMIFWKEAATATEANVAFSVTSTTGTFGRSQGSVQRYSGADTTQAPAFTANTGSGSVVTATGLTTSGDNSVIVTFMGNYSTTTINNPTGMTSNYATASTRTSISSAYLSIPTAGATGNKASSTSVTSWIAHMIEIKLGCSGTAPDDLVAPAVNYNGVDLTWTYDGFNNTSYNVYRDGGQIASGITTGAYTDNTVVDGTPYTYTVRGFNGTCESGNSNPVDVITPVYNINTTTGAINFSNLAMASMKVDVTYSADDDTNNSMTLNYGTAPGGPYPNSVTVSVDRPSRTWSGTVNGLSASTTYYFQATFTDGTVNGTNPLIASQQTRINSLMHSSAVTGDKYTGASYWNGPWGSSFTCNTCHNSPTTNIKRIATTVTAVAPMASLNGLPLVNTTQADGASSGYATKTGSNQVCDGCHTYTAFFRKDLADTDAGVTLTNGAAIPHPDDLDCIKCHEHSKGFKVSAGCVDCHAVGGTYQAATAAPTIVDIGGAALRGAAYGSHLSLTAGENLGTVSSWNDRCTSCHNGHVNTEGVHIPNNATVGIDYARGYISLGGSQTSGATEAEICWNCHDAVGVSEWGVNTDSNGANNNYNFGTVYTDESKTTETSRWIGSYWTSANFTYKEGWLNNQPSAADPINGTAGGGSTHAAASGAGTQQGVDDVASIRCSYCHDVHNTANLKGTVAGDVNGKPYLRGTWMGNPYKEDGAPQSGTAYTDFGFANMNNGATSYWGSVPRASNDASQLLGGYWIDQNSGTPTSNAAYDTFAEFGGLCSLCHGANVNTLNQYGNEGTAGDNADWVSNYNGHKNVVKGGSGVGTGAETTARNIFGGRSGTTTPSYNPYMNYDGMVEPNDSGIKPAVFRGPRSSGRNVPYLTGPSADPDRPWGYGANGWGTEERGATTQANYHTFTCSKCHNPHASRLPRLMVTNCLDTKNNSWDNGYDLMTLSDATNNNSFGQSISQWTSAQNCHRLVGTDGYGLTGKEGAGWNTVTPW